MRVLWLVVKVLRRILRTQKHMANTIEKLAADFVVFQGDFAGFVANVKAALEVIATGGLTPEQQAAVDGIDSAVAGMDEAIKGISFPAPPAVK